MRSIADLIKIPGVVVAFNRNRWMNDELTKDWIKRGCMGVSQHQLINDEDPFADLVDDEDELQTNEVVHLKHTANLKLHHVIDALRHFRMGVAAAFIRVKFIHPHARLHSNYVYSIEYSA